jgi:hypothetical protein
VRVSACLVFRHRFVRVEVGGAGVLMLMLVPLVAMDVPVAVHEVRAV